MTATPPNDNDGYRPGYGATGPDPAWKGQHNPSWTPPPPMRPEDQRTWATLTHIGGIFFSVIPAAVAYFVLRDRGQFIREHTRVALNFNLTMLIAHLAGVVLTVAAIGPLISLAAWVVTVVFSIQAAIAANRGRFFTYPLTIEFFKR
jgi:uncharacterized Tic20 family protein